MDLTAGRPCGWCGECYVGVGLDTHQRDYCEYRRKMHVVREDPPIVQEDEDGGIPWYTTVYHVLEPDTGTMRVMSSMSAHQEAILNENGGLQRMREMCDALERWQRAYRTIVMTTVGTNGFYRQRPYTQTEARMLLETGKCKFREASQEEDKARLAWFAEHGFET